MTGQHGAENIETKGNTYIPIPVTTYVAYQNETSPPVAPVAGGYHGPINMKRLMASVKTMATSHARNSDRPSCSFFRL